MQAIIRKNNQKIICKNLQFLVKIPHLRWSKLVSNGYLWICHLSIPFLKNKPTRQKLMHMELTEKPRKCGASGQTLGMGPTRCELSYTFRGASDL